MKVLYDDCDLVVFIKEPGTDSEKISFRDVFGDTAAGDLYCVHRLDKEVGGVTVYAKNEQTAALLSAGFADHSIKKSYLALCEGILLPEKGQMEDLLFHDRKNNKTFIVQRERKGVKRAVLSYEVQGCGYVPHITGSMPDYRTELPEGQSTAGESTEAEKTEGKDFAVSLVRVELQTGRTHQIRIQFASRKHPLAGDRRYGSKSGLPLFGLWSCRLVLNHPWTKELLEFCSEPDWESKISIKSL